MSSTQGKFQLSSKKKAILDALLAQEGMAPAENKIPRRQESGPAPLSFSQQRLWFFDQFEPASFVYNLLTAVSLRGQLDISALQEAFRELVQRHEALRTTPAKALGVADRAWSIAQLVDAALAVAPALPTENPPDRRRGLTVIQGGKA